MSGRKADSEGRLDGWRIKQRRWCEEGEGLKGMEESEGDMVRGKARPGGGPA